MMFTVRCPRCKNVMKYQTDTRVLTGKSKRCVFCSRSFQVKNHLTRGMPVAGSGDFATPRNH